MESLGTETELSRKVNSAQEPTGQESALARSTRSQRPLVKISGGAQTVCSEQQPREKKMKYQKTAACSSEIAPSVRLFARTENEIPKDRCPDTVTDNKIGKRGTKISK
jgi:hypothetical protein